ncbi:MAG: HNH endonuclease [Muribaculaceae bacterium]|nr:HNH endonuclease [Muribaculaceae bacterium]
MDMMLGEIKHGFEKWLKDGVARDAVHRREILNVCEQVLPWFVRERIDSNFDTLYGVSDPEEVHRLWNKIKTDSELKAKNAERSPVNYTEALRLFENYLRRPAVKGNKTIFSEDKEATNSELLSEGDLVELHITKHERNPELRRRCIEFHGWRCKACGLDFVEKYGELGEDFIEVHHLFPISQTEGEHVVNPEKDLVPLCANCHAMIHRLKGIEMTFEKLQSYINPEYISTNRRQK